MARSTFWERFSYAGWIRHLTAGDAPTFAEIGRAAGGLTGQAISGWKNREKPPTNYELHKPLAAFFDVDQNWLIDEEGDPPRPELWPIWMKERRRHTKPAAASPGGIAISRPAAKQRRGRAG